jgi:anaerobic ribonucleoside-triphosphate reductase activating protein
VPKHTNKTQYVEFMFNTYDVTVVFQEVPNEISLCFTVTGCPIGCVGCHSTELWNPDNGEPLTEQRFKRYLAQYKNLISCVVFMGGEWDSDHLVLLLNIARNQGLKTCLYTGLPDVPHAIKSLLTYLKVGRWDANRGGLSSPTTNQQFIDVATGCNLNYLFLK